LQRVTAKHKVVDRIALGETKFASEGKDAHGIGLTPDGSQIWLSTQTTDLVTVLDSSTYKILGRIPVGRDPNWLDFTPDGKFAVVSNTGSNDVSIIDVALQQVVATVKVGPSPKRLVVGRVAINAVQ
jgi:YVTN family beta-propeller protein